MSRTPTHPDVSFHRDPDLPGVEARLSAYSDRAFRRHTHETYSVAVVEKGATTFELEGVTHRAVAGQLVLIDPHAPHVCNPDPDTTFRYRMFYIDAGWFEQVSAEAFDPAPERVHLTPPVVDDPGLFDEWQRLHVAIMGGADGLEKESALVSAIAATIEHHSAEVPSERHQPAGGNGVDRALAVLSERATERIPLDELAAEAGMSRYHFLRVFQLATGLPPHSYQAQLRVRIASQLLAGGVPIAQAAAEAGFADQSHFTRVFRAFTGATPSQYRASLLGTG